MAVFGRRPRKTPRGRGGSAGQCRDPGQGGPTGATRIRKLTEAIGTDQQKHFRIDDLYGAASSVRKVLSTSIESQLAPIQRFESRYSRTRDGDELVSTHAVTIDISGLKSNRLDLSDLIANIDDDSSKSAIRAQIEVDGVTRPDLTPSARQQPLDPKARTLRIDRIAVPKHSCFYSAPPMEMTAAADSDELASPKSLTLKEMENDKPIRVQVLARWLSFGLIQSNKDLLFFDNFALGLVVTLLASFPAVKLFK